MAREEASQSSGDHRVMRMRTAVTTDAAAAYLSRYMVVILLGVLILVFSLLLPDTFPTFGNFRAIVSTQAPLIVLALGLCFPVATREFDFSVGAVIGFAPILLAVLAVNEGWPLGLAVLTVLGVGLAMGLLNSLLIVRLGVDSFIGTLGTGTILLALTLGVADSQVISGRLDALSSATNNKLFGIPYAAYYAWGLAFVVWYIFRYTPLGRYLYFIGEGREAARLAGLRVDALRTLGLVVASTVAAVAGIMLYGTLGSADPNIGLTYLLPVYAAVFLGAATITPGRVNAWGTVVAVYVLVVGITGIQLMGSAGWWEGVFNGCALVFALAFRQLVIRRGRG